MLVAVLAALVGLAAVLWALYSGQAELRLASPSAPDWDLLPTPGELARVEFPMSLPGYDPATVELTFEALSRVYADLLAAADPATLSRARARAALRRGLDPTPVAPDAAGAAPEWPDPAGLPDAGTPGFGTVLDLEDPDAEALRCAAALGLVAQRQAAPAEPERAPQPPGD